ncbi:hypothetical protein QAD02_012414 [Eretmocerus hayati]|uniref:Uncharacterized protein n=1 Tax=Eretmocerus hayati TaxID=131215 RepID=A0ACC2NZT2_9HYME|nr:hypothetical protein QAD02_012414 [Eretmocerus hayati]
MDSEMDLHAKVLRLTCKLYEKYDFSRAMVQDVIEVMSDFIEKDYNPGLVAEVHRSLEGAVGPKVTSTIHRAFESFKLPFKDFDSELKRLRLYTELGLYKAPEVHTVATLKSSKLSATNLCVSDENVTIVRMPLAKELKRLLEIDILFDATMDSYKFLMQEKHLKINFVPRELWAELTKDVEPGIIVLPLVGYYDAIQIGNGLRSHAAEGNVGNCSVTIACFPLNLSSKLESMVVSDIFLEEDREMYGNKAIFKPFIEEVCYLRRVGIELNLKGFKSAGVFHFMLDDM